MADANASNPDLTEPTIAFGDIQACADRAEFQAQYGFDRPHHFGPVYQMAGGGVKFSAGHERLPCWTFTISPRHETPSGYSIEVWSLGQNLVAGALGGEELYGPPTLQCIDLGVMHPTVGAAIEATKVYLRFLIRDLERTTWDEWRRVRYGSSGAAAASCN